MPEVAIVAKVVVTEEATTGILVIDAMTVNPQYHFVWTPATKVGTPTEDSRGVIC